MCRYAWKYFRLYPLFFSRSCLNFWVTKAKANCFNDFKPVMCNFFCLMFRFVSIFHAFAQKFDVHSSWTNSEKKKLEETQCSWGSLESFIFHFVCVFDDVQLSFLVISPIWYGIWPREQTSSSQNDEMTLLMKTSCSAYIGWSWPSTRVNVYFDMKSLANPKTSTAHIRDISRGNSLIYLDVHVHEHERFPTKWGNLDNEKDSGRVSNQKHIKCAEKKIAHGSSIPTDYNGFASLLWISSVCVRLFHNTLAPMLAYEQTFVKLHAVHRVVSKYFALLLTVRIFVLIIPSWQMVQRKNHFAAANSHFEHRLSGIYT